MSLFPASRVALPRPALFRRALSPQASGRQRHFPGGDGLRRAARGARPALGVFFFPAAVALLSIAASLSIAAALLSPAVSEGGPAMPLPGSLWLLAGGMLGLIEVRRRQRGKGR